MSKIAVVGMGQGGMVAAIKLAEAGYDVTVYEKSARGEVSYEWKDDIRSDVFEICSLPLPPQSVYCQKCKWVFVSPNLKHRLPVPPCPPLVEISVDRRGLSEYFVSLAEGAGCKLVFDTAIDSLAIKDSRVVGVAVGGDVKEYDLVIDASGMRSKLRAHLPKQFGVQAQPKNDGVMYGYRAFFKKVEGAQTVEKGIDATVVLKHLGSAGVSWCNLNEDGNVDVLIGRVGALKREDVEAAIKSLKQYNAILSDELISEKYVEICVRAAISSCVADGYVAIGDSAYMTMPLMGSGIESSMKAGKMFADLVLKNNLQDFSAKNMWAFFVRYMRELGADFALMDTLKRWALALPAKRIDWLFGSGVISKDDLSVLVTTESEGGKLKIRAKTVFLILAHPLFLLSALRCLLRGYRAMKCAEKIPENYDVKRVAKWRKKYAKLIRE